MDIVHYSKYAWVDGTGIVTKDRQFPLVLNKKRVFVTDDYGTTKFIAIKKLQEFIKKEEKKSKGKIVKCLSSGKIFNSIKEAVASTGMTAAKIKASPEYMIQ